MNKKNKYRMAILFIISIFIIPDVIYAADYIKCGNDKYFPLALVNLVSIFFTIIKIAIPILFVISGMVSFMKVTFSSNVDDDMKKAKSKLINNIIAAVVIFFIISIVNFAVGLVAGANNQFMNCVNCFLNSDKCTRATQEEVKKIEGNVEPGFIGGVNTNGGSSSNTNGGPSSNTNSGSSNNTNGQSTNNNTSQKYNITTKNGVTYIDGVLIVNKTYGLPENYKPASIDPYSTVDCWTTNCLTVETITAFNSMKNGAVTDGIDLWIVSGYRTYSQQRQYYNNYVSSSGKAAADTFSARPGHSEHESGLAIDLNDASSQRFPGTKEAIWLNNNCWKYGFILRYPKGKENITGYIYEPWHMRYVGEKLAKILYNNGNWITLEEYFNISSKYSN